MKVAILGANGQLGTDLVECLQSRNIHTIALTHQDVPIENLDVLSATIDSLKPDVVINTAAFHVVPQCEENPLRAYQVNALGALNVARAAEKVGASDVYIGTDYVFDGKKRIPYVEDDIPNPLNVYASTKLLGEYYTLNYSAKGLVLRVSGLYGKTPCRAKGGNFITMILQSAKVKQEVKVVNDEVLTPTPTREIAEKILEFLDVDAFGLFHLTAEGECSWYEFSRVIFDTLGVTTPLRACSVSDFPAPVKRPMYSVLENAKAKSLGLPKMRHWRDSLVSFLRENYG